MKLEITFRLIFINQLQTFFSLNKGHLHKIFNKITAIIH